jgi:uncharacterized protein (DUF608 family)
MGAVNGIAPDGSLVKTNEQVQEVRTGTTFGLAAMMLSEGLKDESLRAAWGIYCPSAIWAMEMTRPESKLFKIYHWF